MVYNERHKILLQTIIQEGVFDANKAKDLCIKLFENSNVPEIVNQINEKLQPLNMTIRRAQCEITGQVYWILVNTVLDEVTRFQDEFSKAHLALLRDIFTEIITSSDGGVQSTICLNLCSTLDVKLSKSEAEEFLNDIVQRMWLTYKDGCYYMGIRSITELMPYFRASYEGNLNTCLLCKQTIFHGEKCRKCDSVIHLYCLENYARIHNPVKCPKCDQAFPITDLSGVLDKSAVSPIEEQIAIKRHKRKH